VCKTPLYKCNAWSWNVQSVDVIAWPNDGDGQLDATGAVDIGRSFRS